MDDLSGLNEKDGGKYVKEYILEACVDKVETPIKKKKSQPVWNLLFLNDPGADRIVNIGINIGDLIRETHDLTLQCCRRQAGLMIQDTVPHFPGQVQSHTVLLETFHHTHALLIVPEASHILRDPV